MASVSNILLDQEILLECGTNEMELLVFKVAHFHFGINVAKVREVLPKAEITRLAKSHPSVRGVFRLRERVVPCVSLIDHLEVEPTRSEEVTESNLILTDFNQQQTAFLVDEVERIHRISWETIMPVPGLENLGNTPITAVARIEDQLILLLDFEMIIDQVTDNYFSTDAVANPNELPRETLRIVLADDSATVRQAVGTTLRNSGYTQLEIFHNGKQAWDWLENEYRQTQNVREVAHLVLSDIEMPQMDGFHLTKRIKTHPELSKIPVLLYSSIATPDNHKKGEAVGADAQITKPELDKVVQIADRLITEASEGVVSGKAVADTKPQAAELVAPVENIVEPPKAVETPKQQAKAEVPSEPPSPTTPVTEPVLGEEAPTHYPPPVGVNESLWLTFHGELGERSSELDEQLSELTEEGADAGELQTSVLRILHTIKSASMVVPVDEITRATHLAEELFGAIRPDDLATALDTMQRYCGWLQELSDPFFNPTVVLAKGDEIAAMLSGVVQGK